MDSGLLGLLVVFGMGLMLWAVLARGTWRIRVDLRRGKAPASDDRSIRSRGVQDLGKPLSVGPHVDDNFKLRELRIPSASVQPADASRGATLDEDEMPVITAADHRELTAAIIAARKLAAGDGSTGLLQEKLVHATIVPRNDLPPDVITMHTRAELVDVETNEQLELLLVYPVDGNVWKGRISIFHPLGVAMLGRRVGEQVEWQVPYGTRRFQVSAVQFQPEAALAIAA